MYSSVDEAKEEAHQYATLHPATIDREEHVYTPPLVRTHSPASSQQEHTYSSLDQRKGQRSTESKAAAAAAQSNDIESSDSDDEPAAHTYFTLELDHKEAVQCKPLNTPTVTLDRETLNHLHVTEQDHSTRGMILPAIQNSNADVQMLCVSPTCGSSSS